MSTGGSETAVTTALFNGYLSVLTLTPSKVLHGSICSHDFIDLLVCVFITTNNDLFIARLQVRLFKFV